MLSWLDLRTIEIRCPVEWMSFVHGYGRRSYINKVPEDGGNLFVIKRRIGRRWLVCCQTLIRMNCKCSWSEPGGFEAVIESLRHDRVELDLARVDNHVVIIRIFHVSLIFIFFSLLVHSVDPNVRHGLLCHGSIMGEYLVERLHSSTMCVKRWNMLWILNDETIISGLVWLRDELWFRRRYIWVWRLEWRLWQRLLLLLLLSPLCWMNRATCFWREELICRSWRQLRSIETRRRTQWIQGKQSARRILAWIC